ncbi:MAG: hypothetical protein PGN09_10825 [Sphingomonas fennica]
MAKAPVKSTWTKEAEYRRLHAESAAIKVHREEAVLYPKLWKRYKAKRALSWKTLPFNEATRAKVPKTQGLYAFVVKPEVGDLPPSGWLFYIGEVGATASPSRTFWKRYEEYLGELSKVTRPKMSMLLERYKGYIHFYYCELDPKTVDLKAVEAELITAAWPYANIKDFDVQYRQLRRAFA